MKREGTGEEDGDAMQVDRPAGERGVSLVEWEEDLTRAQTAGLLSLAGLQARVLAEKEEREVGRLLQDLLEIRVKRMEIKVGGGGHRESVRG